MTTHYKLGPMARQLTSGQKCNVTFIGDSTAAAGSSPRWGQSIIKTWDLDWRERILLKATSSAPDEGFSTLNAPTTYSPGASLPDSTVVPAGYIDCGYKAYASYQPFNVITRVISTVRQDYYRGDPWLNQPIRWRLMALGTSDPLEAIDFFDRDDNGTAAGGSIRRTDPITAASGAWQVLELTYAADSTPAMATKELLIQTTNTINHTGKQFAYGGWSIAVNGKTDGVQMQHVAVGGYTVKDHIPTALGGDSTAFTDATRTAMFNYFDAWPDLIIIQLGINMETAESNDIRGAWGANLRTLMDWHVGLADAAGEASPQFMLINPWATDSTEARRADISAELREIADERSDTGVLDLYQAVKDQLGSYSTWQATQLSDGVHQSTTGVVTFGEISWNVITQAASTGGGLLRRGNLSGIIGTPLAGKF